LTRLLPLKKKLKQLRSLKKKKKKKPAPKKPDPEPQSSSSIPGFDSNTDSGATLSTSVHDRLESVMPMEDLAMKATTKPRSKPALSQSAATKRSIFETDSKDSSNTMKVPKASDGEGSIEILPNLGNYPIGNGPCVHPRDQAFLVVALDEDHQSKGKNGLRNEVE
jgi:hypothetical protein